MSAQSEPVDISERQPHGPDLVLGLDASTTAVKCLLFDHQGTAVSQGRAELELQTPEPLGYEQDAQSWWTACAAAIRQAVQPIEAKRLAAACITHQRETVVVTDRSGQPSRPALVWMDERCRPQVELVKAHYDVDRIHRESGKPVCATPSLYKLLWLRSKEPSLFGDEAMVLEVHAFLVHRLTGHFHTGLACADPTGLVDLARGDWSEYLLGIAGLDSSQMARIYPVGAEIGRVHAEASARTGLPEGLPIVAGAGDGQAAALGAGITGPGKAYLNLGTAMVSGFISDVYRADPAFRTMAGAVGGSYLLETDLKGGTFTINWLLQRWFPQVSTAQGRRELLMDLERQAGLLPAGCQGLVVVPYWCGVMNPYWDDEASGLVLGWRSHHTPAHLYRSILEGLAFEQRLHLERVETATGQPIPELVVVGGGAASDLWCQIVADVTRRPVRRANTLEASALGAGILAAAGSGLHPDLPSAVGAMTAQAELFSPGPMSPTYDRLYREVYIDLYPSTRDAMHGLARLCEGHGE